MDSIRLSLPEMARKVVSGKGQVCLACATLRKGRGQLPRSCALGLLLRRDEPFPTSGHHPSPSSWVPTCLSTTTASVGIWERWNIGKTKKRQRTEDICTCQPALLDPQTRARFNGNEAFPGSCRGKLVNTLNLHRTKPPWIGWASRRNKSSVTCRTAHIPSSTTWIRSGRVSHPFAILVYPSIPPKILQPAKPSS